MTTTRHTPAAASRPKTFTFSTAADWLSGRAAMLRDSGKIEFRVAPPPEFRGESNVWSPEHLFVAAVDTCLLITFAGLAEKADLTFLSYRSEAEGLLEWVDGSFRFTAVMLRPRIVVEDEPAKALAQELLARAHDTCLIANSLRASVMVEPDIQVKPGS